MKLLRQEVDWDAGTITRVYIVELRQVLSMDAARHMGFELIDATGPRQLPDEPEEVE